MSDLDVAKLRMIDESVIDSECSDSWYPEEQVDPLGDEGLDEHVSPVSFSGRQQDPVPPVMVPCQISG
jgi:hypothetical protein